MKMMRIPAVWTTNLVALLFGVGMYAIFAFLPEFLQTPSSAGYGFGASITESGLIVLPMSVTMFIFGSWSGRLSTRLGAKVVLIAGSVVSIPAFVDHGLRARLDLADLTSRWCCSGPASGWRSRRCPTSSSTRCPSHQTGVASGMNANIRTIGGSIGAAVMASIVTSGASSERPAARSPATPPASAMLAAALVLASLAGAADPEPEPAPAMPTSRNRPR